MSTVIISYNRDMEAAVKGLADDIGALGHSVWFDQELGGGQAWWDQILEQVRACDIFVFALSPEALKSTACQREYQYADKLGKPILPVLVAEGVSTNLLPPALAKTQFVRYLERDPNTVLRLARAFTTVPPPEPMPEPLPDPPEVPISYLGSLREQVETTATLGSAEQSELLLDLKRSLRDPETAEDGRTLLKALESRRDLLATIAKEIDELLGRTVAASHPPSPSAEAIDEVPEQTRGSSPPSPFSTTEGDLLITRSPSGTLVPTPASDKHLAKILRRFDGLDTQGRVVGALVGGATGATIGVIAVRLSYPEDWSAGLILGIAGAIAGTITGRHKRLNFAAVIGGAVGFFACWVGFLAVGGEPLNSAVAGATVYGGSLGLIVGAIVGVVLKKWRGWV